MITSESGGLLMLFRFLELVGSVATLGAAAYLFSVGGKGEEGNRVAITRRGGQRSCRARCVRFRDVAPGPLLFNVFISSLHLIKKWSRA